MISEQHTMKPPSSVWGRALAVLTVSCLAAAACGSGDAPLDGQVSIGTPVSSEQGGPQYGDSLEEWVDAVESEPDQAPEPPVVNDYPVGYELVTWDDLVPPGYSGDQIAARYQQQLSDLEDGSPEADAIYAEMQAEYDAKFLLVPYFGACIHVPAPPPNQTILVTLDKADGLTFDESWGAVWVAGTLTVDDATTDLATASYAMTGAASGVYDEYG